MTIKTRKMTAGQIDLYLTYLDLVGKYDGIKDEIEGKTDIDKYLKLKISEIQNTFFVEDKLGFISPQHTQPTKTLAIENWNKTLKEYIVAEAREKIETATDALIFVGETEKI